MTTARASAPAAAQPDPISSAPPEPRRAWARAVVARSSLLATLREDRQANFTALAPGFQAIAALRVGQWAARADAPRWARTPARLASRAGYYMAKNVYGIELPHTVELGRRVTIAHQHGIVIHPRATLGDDVVIRQGVTLGGGRGDARIMEQAPQIGAGVSLGAGACVVGRVRIGDGATIGPNAVVMTNIPEGATVLAQPPRVIQLQRATPVGDAGEAGAGS